MGERFGYYIMNAVLILFLCSKFGLSDGASGMIASAFLTLIYILSLVGGIVADRTSNYKGTIITGLVLMSLGYVLLTIPITATDTNKSWLLPFTCAALFIISLGNGFFKGNLQAIVGQMYDNLEEQAAKKGKDELDRVKGLRDSGFQIFYVFINIGALVAPFIAPYLRGWWLAQNGFTYHAKLPALCHKFINDAAGMSAEEMQNIKEWCAEVSNGAVAEPTIDFCNQYLEVFNTGVHYSFWASVVAMGISLVIFLVNKKTFPTPAKKAAAAAVDYTEEERRTMAAEIRQRMMALFAVLGIAVFFWFSFHQNAQSLSIYARDFVDTSSIAPEVWQAVNPFFVIFLTPVIMAIFAWLAKRGFTFSTPRKIAIGMFIAGIAYLVLLLVALANGYPSGETFNSMPAEDQNAMKAGAWVLLTVYFFLTVAELFISPLGLSFVSKVAPKHLQGLCQGLWLGATAVGNGLIWLGPVMLNVWPQWMCWTVFLAVCLLSMAIMLSMVKWLEKVCKTN
ncbi:MAG: peptide MFS transporter [Parasporobacterium sp.]|nr:peptide MFS transporter [Parasporobacterium sp.]